MRNLFNLRSLPYLFVLCFQVALAANGHTNDGNQAIKAFRKPQSRNALLPFAGGLQKGSILDIASPALFERTWSTDNNLAGRDELCGAGNFYCSAAGGCCLEGERCYPEGCCPLGQFKCGANGCYIPEKYQCCPGETNICRIQHECVEGGECCWHGQQRCGDGCYIPEKYQCCFGGTHVCEVGETCIEGGCCPVGEKPCGSGCYNPAVEKCCSTGTCDRGYQCCDYQCCTSGYFCEADGYCRSKETTTTNTDTATATETVSVTDFQDNNGPQQTGAGGPDAAEQIRLGVGATLGMGASLVLSLMRWLM